MEERKPSCDVSPDFIEQNPNWEYLKKMAARKGFENDPKLIEQAESMGITPAKLKSMREYAVNLRKQNPRMKMSTVRARILEKYKIHLV